MIDATSHISTVRRALTGRTLEAGEAKVSTISQVYDTGLDELWEAVTTPERIARWFAPVSGELKEGGHYQIEGNASGTVTSCERPRSYAATWEFGGQTSWIEVRLTPEGDERTRFELEHVAHMLDEFWDQYGPGATGVGWELGLFGLANHLSDPAAPLDPKAAEAWGLSPAGKAFIRTSADAWAAAAIEDGDDPAHAREAADRTFAFYTGA